MDFGTALTEKRELVLAAFTALVHLTVRGGNRVGAVVGNRSADLPHPGDARACARRYLLRRIATTPRATDAAGRDGEGSVAQMLTSLRRPPRRRGLVAVVSDFIDSAVDRRAAGLGAAAGRPLAAAPAARRRDRRPARTGAGGSRTGHLRRPGDRRSARGADLLRRDPRALRAGGWRAAGQDRDRPAACRRRPSAAAHRPRLAGRHRPLRDRPAALLAGGGGVRGGALRQGVR